MPAAVVVVAFLVLPAILVQGFLFPAGGGGCGGGCCGGGCCGAICPPEPEKEPEKPPPPPPAPPSCAVQCPCQCPPSVIYYPQPVPSYLVARPPGYYATSPPLPPPVQYTTTPIPPYSSYTQAPYSATYIGPASPPGPSPPASYSYTQSPPYESFRSYTTTSPQPPSPYGAGSLVRFTTATPSPPAYGYTLAPYGTERHGSNRNNNIQQQGRVKRETDITFAECHDDRLRESLAQALTGSDFARDDGRILYQLPIRSSLVVFCSKGNLAVSELDSGHRICTLSKNDVNCAVVT